MKRRYWVHVNGKCVVICLLLSPIFRCKIIVPFPPTSQPSLMLCNRFKTTSGKCRHIFSCTSHVYHKWVAMFAINHGSAADVKLTVRNKRLFYERGRQFSKGDLGSFFFILHLVLTGIRWPEHIPNYFYASLCLGTFS